MYRFIWSIIRVTPKAFALSPAVEDTIISFLRTSEKISKRWWPLYKIEM
jgi:hypothetical protein